MRRLLLLVILLVPAALSQLPEASRAKIAEALQLAAAGEFQSSERILLDLEKQHPSNVEVQYRLGLVLLRLRNLPEAGRRLESAAKLRSDIPTVWLAVARVRLQLGQRAEALQAIERANSLAPDDPVVWRASAMFFSQAEDFAKAAGFEARWAKANPQDEESPLRAVEYFLRAGKTDRAIQLGEETLARHDTAAVHNLLGKAYRLEGDPARAVEELQRAVRLAPAEPGYYGDFAQLFLDHRTPEPALLILGTAVERFPGDPELLRLLGLTHYATGDTGKALDAFLKMTDIDPESELGYASLETLLPYAGDRMEEITSKLRRFSERHPGNPLGFYLLALAISAQSPESAESQALLEKAIAAEPSFWPAYFELHKRLAAAEDFDEAVKALEKTVELNPEHELAHYSLSRIYARLGERERAMSARKLHHQLVIEKRKASEKQREANPRLPFSVNRPAGTGPGA